MTKKIKLEEAFFPNRLEVCRETFYDLLDGIRSLRKFVYEIHGMPITIKEDIPENKVFVFLDGVHKRILDLITGEYKEVDRTKVN